MIYPEEELEDWMDDRVEEWHICFAGSTDYPSLEQWLGWTEEEFSEWFLNGTIPQRDIDLFVKLKDANAI